MTVEIDHAVEQYVRHVFDVINGVQNANEIRERAFAESEHWAREVTRLLKGTADVS